MTPPYIYKGTINCSDNPNYPIGNKDDYWIVDLNEGDVTGKIGGDLGDIVYRGDMIVCVESTFYERTKEDLHSKFVIIVKTCKEDTLK